MGSSGSIDHCTRLSHRPIRGPEDGLDYPYTNYIARQMDALQQAKDVSEEAVETYESLYGRNRRKRHLSEEVTKGTADHGLLSRALEVAHPQGRKLSENEEPRAGMQYQQEEALTAALFVYKARDGNNVFSDDSLSELCKLHEALTGHEQYTNYCLKRAGFVAAADDDESSSGASTSMRTTYCATGMTPLALFYGGASYDVDNLDMSAFDDAELSQIYSALSTDPTAANVAYGSVRIGKASALLNKIDGYFTQHWINGTMITGAEGRGCTPALKKDSAKVLQLLGHIRANRALNAQYGGILNYYLDGRFNASNLRSVYTRGTFDYGGPLEGYDNIISSSDEKKQQDAWGTWWLDSGFKEEYADDKGKWPTVLGRSLQPHHSSQPVLPVTAVTPAPHSPQSSCCSSTRALSSTLCAHLFPLPPFPPHQVEPTCLIVSMLLQELLMLLAFDGARAVVPIVLVFLIVWMQTRSLFIAILTLTEQILSFVCAIFLSGLPLQIEPAISSL